jgi:putative PEP-CTERM system histidine kinase
MLAQLPVIGYGLAALAFLVLTLLLLTSWQGRMHGALLVSATGLSAVWGVGLAFTVSPNPEIGLLQIFTVETLRNGAWLLFLGILFADGTGGRTGHRVLVCGGPLLALAVFVAGTATFVVDPDGPFSSATGLALILGSLVLSLFGLILLEQIYRNARTMQRATVKYLCLGLSGLFAYDLVLYSQAVLFEGIDPVFWSVRGFVAALCVPLIAIAAQRNPDWSVGIFVSRQVVFYTTTLMGVGFYLVAMAAIGYYIRGFGDGWGPAVQVLFVAVAMLVLGLLLFSDKLRARLRVSISKHFFRNRYDYREEWLRLIDTLASPEDPGLPLQKRAIKALSDILQTPGGVLFLREGGEYRCVAGWDTAPNGELLSADRPLPAFVARTGWVIDVTEYRRDPARYERLDLQLERLGVDNPGVVVPLVTEDALLGFVVLAASSRPYSLNYEDRDLLKTAGRQIASYLDQEQKKFALAESRQFEAFNRLTAYLMHDLKNVTAQLSLVVQNATIHRDNKDFFDDAIRTVDNGVRRMKRVLEQLRQGTPVPSMGRIEAGKLIMEAVSQCADRRPEPRALVGDGSLWVRGNRERLLMAIVHAIRNAQDATPAGGSIRVSLETAGGQCVIRVTDTGSGMEPEFVRTRLFRPFDSTKGVHGMGIGAYQLRETARSLSGELTVDSEPGRGTTVSLVLPIERVEGAA